MGGEGEPLHRQRGVQCFFGTAHGCSFWILVSAARSLCSGSSSSRIARRITSFASGSDRFRGKRTMARATFTYYRREHASRGALGIPGSTGVFGINQAVVLWPVTFCSAFFRQPCSARVHMWAFWPYTGVLPWLSNGQCPSASRTAYVHTA